MSKKVWLGIALILGLPLIAIGALYLLVDPQKFAPALVSNLDNALQRKTSIGKLEFQIIPLAFRTSDLSISDDPAFSSRQFLTAKSLEVRPSILPLLAGNLEIQSLILNSPNIELIQNAAGEWNYSTIGGKKKPDEPSTLKLARLVIDNAKVGVMRAGSPRDEYSNLAAELRDYAEGQPFFLKLAAMMQNGKAIAAEGTISASKARTTLSNVTLNFASLTGKVDGEIADTKMNLKLNIPKSPVSGAAPLFLPQGMNVQGDIAADITATGTTKQPVLNGHLTLTGFEVSGGSIKQPVRTKQMGLKLTPERITLEPATIISGATTLQAFGSVTNYQATPRVEATLLAPNAQVAELVAIARAYGISAVEGIEASGQANLQVRAHGEITKSSSLGYTGSGSLRNAVFKLPSLTKPLEIASTDFKFESASASLSNISAKLGSSNLSGDCRVENFASPAIDFNLVSDRLALDEVRSLFREQKSSGASSSRMTANGELKVGTVQLENLTLTQLTAHAAYRNNRLLLNPLNASMYGGRHSGSIDILFDPNKPVYTLNSKLEKIESKDLLAAATSIKGIISGPLNAGLNLTFSPADPAQLARSLNGKLSLNLGEGRIAGFNLMKELGTVAKFLGANVDSQKFTQFASIVGDLDINSGQANTRNLKLTMANLTATLNGNMNLADQTLDLKLLSILDKRFSEQVGGNNIGGFMTAALANSSGNLMIPASIRGTFSNPTMAPDPAAIAKMKLEGFSPANPKQMMESVGSVLDLFKKKKKEN